MLTRVKSQSNPINVQKKLITEPSEYLQQLQQLQQLEGYIPYFCY